MSNIKIIIIFGILILALAGIRLATVNKEIPQIIEHTEPAVITTTNTIQTVPEAKPETKKEVKPKPEIDKKPTVKYPAPTTEVMKILELTNKTRAEVGARPLVLQNQLSLAAQNKIDDMVAKGYFAHTSPDGRTKSEFVMDTGYYYSVIGENLARNFATVDELFSAWLQSPTHYDTMIDPRFDEVGIAIGDVIVDGVPLKYAVQMFALNSHFNPDL